MSIRCTIGFHDWSTTSLVIQDNHVHQHVRECRRCETLETPAPTCLKNHLVSCRCSSCINPRPPTYYCTSELCGRPAPVKGKMCNVCWGEASTYYPCSGYTYTAKELRLRELNNGDVCLHNSCQKCHGTGQTPDGPCFHNISCPCSKCTPR